MREPCFLSIDTVGGWFCQGGKKGGNNFEAAGIFLSSAIRGVGFERGEKGGKRRLPSAEFSPMEKRRGELCGQMVAYR